MYWESRFSKDAQAVKASQIRELLKLLGDPEILSFAGGIPDPALFPMDEVARIRTALRDDADLDRAALQYSATEGYAPLRDWVAASRSTPDIALDRDNVLITNGAQQGLSLLATTLIETGAPIAVEDPTYLGALQVFGARRPRFVTVATDGDGLIIDSLEAALHQGVQFLYTIPDFQNPGGMSISEDRRKRMIELAHQYQTPIIEDAAYRALYYDAPPPPSLLELEGEYLGAGGWRDKGLVVQLGTTSKTLMPALRVGWTIAAPGLLEKLILLKQAGDLHTSTFNQIMAYELSTGIQDAHSETLRRVYGERRDAMVASLRKHLPNSVRFTTPHGGMFVWLTLPDGMDAAHLLERALSEKNLAFVPGASFHAKNGQGGGGENTLRLSFATHAPEVIDDGVRRLADLIADAAAKNLA